MHSPTAPASQTAPAADATLAQSAYMRLRSDIVEGHLAPGEKLRVEHLKDRYEVGAGTLREALALLVADALVVQHGHRGFRVTPISLADFIDITETRVQLETEALRQSVALGDDAWEADLTSAFHLLTLAEERLGKDGEQDVGQFAQWETRNRAFHEVLIRACPSRWLHHFLAILYRQSERYRRLSITHRPVPRDVHEEHQAIFDACLARDADRAATLLAAHIRKTLEAVRELPDAVINAGTVPLAAVR
ncbi:GntR family transcriptional regulator [Pandoraea sputorum]|uniref:Carbon starvation induced regulator n=1 Tax=Pandoraea sputorum TaxID=93222 RepID=A0A239S8L1_9BURK|nr:FCD domain-containing protein [Pandoraea sputorum]AJC15942.1 transcriptional regulator [Pandoraea sputorum]MCE4062174.1 FCD domain-containing protein [Pandoraea sputorum]SNU81785.1 Carbon starvation induced regulator [Pandoraea sputorum]VVD63274.1 transcriptional regulator [Pandoraea sputorum]VVE75899.1 transcriptional regulator [Pandoraea sputorum]